MALHRAEIFAIQTNVGYFITPDFHYYGIVNAGEDKIVIGPTRQIAQDEQELRTMAFRLDVPPEEVGDFVTGMQHIVHMPLDSVMQMLCVVNYILNGEKLGLADIAIYDGAQQALKRTLAATPMEQPIEEPETAQQEVHNTLLVEETVTRMIRTGDTEALQRWLRSAPAVRAGVMAADQLRQIKNTFLVTATLASRAAIQGGVEPEVALSLSDAFIQKCELLSDLEQIINLQYGMVLEYTERVARLHRSACGSQLAAQVVNYIHRHLSEAITVEAIAQHLYLSRPYLSAKFKQETGLTLTDFILREKTAEAKYLLRHTDKSLSAIGDYLGFSSQSHFSKVFRRYAGCSPSAYRGREE
jgi:YSIRK-targeted surface antigen transcriptional regulator